MRNYNKIIIVATILMALSPSLLLPAYAGAKGRKNTAMAMTAATVYSAITKKDRQALILGIGSAQAWKNYEDARKRESRQRTYRRSSYNYSRPSSYGSTGSRRHAYRSSRPQYRATRSYAVYNNSTRKMSAANTSASQIKQLQTQVAQLKASHTAIESKMKLQALQAENASIKAELAEQKTLIAEARSNSLVSKAGIGIFSLLAIAALSIAAFGIIPKRWQNNNLK